MKMLIDNALSPVVAEGLRQAGYDAVHVRDFRMEQSSDEDIFTFACELGPYQQVSRRGKCCRS